MSLAVSIYTSAGASVLDLNGSSNTDIKLVHFQYGDPVTDEAWEFSWHADGGALAKSKSRPRRMKFGLAIPPQTSMANLRTKVELVRTGFLTTGNRVRIVWDADAAILHPIIRSVVPSVLEGDAENARRVSIHRLVKLWEIECWVEPFPVGLLTSPVL